MRVVKTACVIICGWLYASGQACAASSICAQALFEGNLIDRAPGEIKVVQSAWAMRAESWATTTNQFEFPFEETIKWASDGEHVYVKRVFQNGRMLFCRFDINDPGQNETPITRQAYRAVRSAEFRRQPSSSSGSCGEERRLP